MSARDRRLSWFGVGAAPVAWTLHLLISYGYEEAACSNRTGVSAVAPVIVGSGAVLLAVSLAGMAAAFAVWRGAGSGRLPDPRGRLRFMGGFGLVASPVFAFATLLETVLALWLEACAPG